MKKQLLNSAEIKMDRMESKYYPGLFLIGEIIDFDGPCGGFNLQNAWETGIKAASAIAKSIIKGDE